MKAQPSPAAVPPALESLLQEKMDALTVAKAPKPEWLSTLLSYRDLCAGCAFYSDVANSDGLTIYLFIVGMCQPQKAIFLECHKVRPAVSSSLYDLPGGISPQICSYGNFHFDNLHFVDHTEVPWTSLSDICVLPQCLLRGSNVAVIAESMPWSSFVRWEKPSVVVKTSQSDQLRRSRVPIPEDILLQLQLECLWLTLDQIRHMLQTKTTVGGHGGGEDGQSNTGSSGSSSRPVEQDIPEDVVVKVVETSQLGDRKLPRLMIPHHISESVC